LNIRSGILSIAPAGQEDMLNYIDESIRSSPNVFERKDLPELAYTNAHHEEDHKIPPSAKEYKLSCSKSSFIQTKTDSLKVQRKEMNKHKQRGQPQPKVAKIEDDDMKKHSEPDMIEIQENSYKLEE
jgi:hypothetical protein